MSITQREIAQHLGISRAQVGKALQDGAYSDVSPSTRERVVAAAQELGYSRYSNQSARSLIARRYGKRALTGIIALLLPGLAGRGALRGTPYYDPYLDGIEQEADDLGLDILICARRDGGLSRQVQQGGVDGVISFMDIHWDFLSTIDNLGLPLVTLDVHWGDHSILADSRDGMEQVVRYLIRAGHRQLVYLGSRRNFPVPVHVMEDEHPPSVREAAYRHTLEAHHLSPSVVNIEYPFTAQDISLLLDQRPFTALVCYNDDFAMKIIPELNAHGLRVPDDVSVTGFDDTSLEFDFRPTLTSVRFSRLEMGKRAVRLLQQEIMNPLLEHRHEKFPAELILRDSTRLLKTTSV